MHWRVVDGLHRWGPSGLMAASLGLVGLLLLQPLSGVPGYAEVEPVRIASLEAARVSRVDVAPGTLVRAGDVVGVLDDSPIQGRIRVLKAELARHGASLATAEAGARSTARTAKADVAEVATRLSGAREALQLARARLEAAEQQVSRGLTTRDTLVEPRADVARWQSEVQRLQVLYQRNSASLDEASAAAGNGEGPAPAALTEVRAQGVVQEELSVLQERLQHMTLRAPVDARVVAVHYRAGEVLPAQIPFVELLPLQTTTVAACLPEQYAEAVEAGSSARMSPAAGGDVRTGTVVDVVGLVSEAPERCKQRPNEIGWVRPVRIQVDGAGLVPGQRFDVTFGEAL